MVFDWTDFVLAGVSSSIATIFTNPLELLKTRIQLQGELMENGSYQKSYKNIWHASYNIYKYEGLLAFQKGLVPSLVFQFIMYGSRLGIYEAAVREKWVINKKTGKPAFLKNMFFGAVGGIFGGLLSSPWFMLKTQLQSHCAEDIEVGYQHKHDGLISGFKYIYNKYGRTGIMRGYLNTIPRSIVGGGAQIGFYGTATEYLEKHKYFDNRYTNSFFAGIVSGSAMSLFMTPWDLISTRLYNQPFTKEGRGKVYKSIPDCARKVINTEGYLGLYKGFWSNYARITPHTTIVLFIFDNLLYIRESRRKGK